MAIVKDEGNLQNEGMKLKVGLPTESASSERVMFPLYITQQNLYNKEEIYCFSPGSVAFLII